MNRERDLNMFLCASMCLISRWALNDVGVWCGGWAGSRRLAISTIGSTGLYQQIPGRLR